MVITFRRCVLRTNSEFCLIQGVSRLVDITAGVDFLGLCDQKVHTNMCPILDGYGVMTAGNLEEKVKIIDNKRSKIINQHNT